MNGCHPTNKQVLRVVWIFTVIAIVVAASNALGLYTRVALNDKAFTFLNVIAIVGTSVGACCMIFALVFIKIEERRKKKKEQEDNAE